MFVLVLAALSAVNGTPVVGDLLDWRERSPEARKAWLERAEPKLRELGERFEKSGPDERALVEYAVSVLERDASAVKVISAFVELDLANQLLRETPRVVSPELQRTVHEKAAVMVATQPKREALWRLLHLTARIESDADRLSVLRELRRCVVALPSAKWCAEAHAEQKARYVSPVCKAGHFKKLVWKHNGVMSPLQAGLNARFGVRSSADVVMKLEPGVSEPKRWSMHFPMREEDLQLVAGDDVVGFASPPPEGEKAFVLHTRAGSLDEAVSLLCAKPGLPKLPADAELPRQ
ncbi:MAG: hypothetical protein DI536_35860 [Archangium gephyra]|uniref:Uncharacterized protein n=1 Tax=Archangium gephyra TaxID=48 RepID=A0A2W5UJS1_9BACT|nr:MAG: hypothetical protein DI536_35860 [Archangium gephyra]